MVFFEVTHICVGHLRKNIFPSKRSNQSYKQEDPLTTAFLHIVNFNNSHRTIFINLHAFQITHIILKIVYFDISITFTDKLLPDLSVHEQLNLVIIYLPRLPIITHRPYCYWKPTKVVILLFFRYRF